MLQLIEYLKERVGNLLGAEKLVQILPAEGGVGLDNSFSIDVGGCARSARDGSGDASEGRGKRWRFEAVNEELLGKRGHVSREGVFEGCRCGRQVLDR